MVHRATHWAKVGAHVPKPERTAFTKRVAHAAREYSNAYDDGLTAAKGTPPVLQEIARAAKRAAADVRVGRKPKPLSTLSHAARRHLLSVVPSDAKLRRRSGTALALSGMRIVVEKQGKRAPRRRIKLHTLADKNRSRPKKKRQPAKKKRQPAKPGSKARVPLKLSNVKRKGGRPTNAHLILLLSRLAFAWAKATGRLATSRHDVGSLGKSSPFAAMLRDVLAAAQINLPISVDQAAKRVVEFRSRQTKKKKKKKKKCVAG